MAFILHGSCSLPHGHSHGGHGHSHGSHGHSHSPPAHKAYRRLKSVSESSQHNGGGGGAHTDTDLAASPAFIVNGHLSNVVTGRGSLTAVTVGGRSDSVCSYRSPSHSRTSSFSRGGQALGGAAGGGSNVLSTAAAAAKQTVLQMRADSVTDGDESGVAAVAAADRHEHDARSNINLRAAVIHVIGDFIQSVGVFVASVVIYYHVSAPDIMNRFAS